MRVYVRWPLKLKGRDKDSTGKKYYEKIVSYQPDALIVVCTQTWTFDWLIPYLDNLSCAKVFYSHGYSAWKETYPIAEKLKHRNVLGVYEIWKTKRYYNKLKTILPKYDLAIYLSEYNNSYLYAQEHHLTNGVILENAVEDIFFKRHAYLIDENRELVFINISSYHERKNQKLILEAFYEADLKKARLILIGSQSTNYHQELLALNCDLEKKCEVSSSKVEILCGITREEIYKIYKKADVYVSASTWEAMSISLCEAAAAGLTILTTDVGHASIIPGVLFCETKEDFARGMRLVHEDSQLRAEKGKMAYEYAKNNYVIENKVNEIERYLLELVNSET